jgi:hypothetical protein
VGRSTDRRGRRGDKIGIIVDMLLDVPFREAFKGPYNHVLGLAYVGVLVFQDNTVDVARGGIRIPRGVGNSYQRMC